MTSLIDDVENRRKKIHEKEKKALSGNERVDNILTQSCPFDDSSFFLC